MASKDRSSGPVDHPGVVFVEKIREGDLRCDVFEPTSGAKELYVDGHVGLILGSSTTKIGLYTTLDVYQENDQTVDQRLVQVRLVIPTKALLEFCAKTLANIALSRDQLIANHDAERAQLVAWLGMSPEEGKT